MHVSTISQPGYPTFLENFRHSLDIFSLIVFTMKISFAFGPAPIISVIFPPEGFSVVVEIVVNFVVVVVVVANKVN